VLPERPGGRIRAGGSNEQTREATRGLERRRTGSGEASRVRRASRLRAGGHSQRLFPSCSRGYDREAVDAHLKRVNRLIAEIKVSASPRAAVRHALEQTEQQVTGLLERARETADELTTSAQREAETAAEAVRAKAAELLVNANAEADATKTEANRLLADSKAEAETVLASARADAEDILVRARLEAEKTVKGAQAEAEERLQQLQAELATLRDQTGADARVPRRHQRGVGATSPAARGNARHGEQPRRSGRCSC